MPRILLRGIAEFPKYVVLLKRATAKVIAEVIAELPKYIVFLMRATDTAPWL